MQTVTVVTGPAVEPVSVDEVKAYAKVDDDVEDDLIATFIEAARVAAENYTRRSFITRTLRLSLDNAGYGRGPWMPGHYELPVDFFDGCLPRELTLPLGPVSAVNSVTTYDTLNADTLYPDTSYAVFGDRLVLNSGSSWPSGLRSVAATEIEYVAGYGEAPSDVPRPIRHAITMTAALMYERNDLCTEMPAGAMQLLSQYRVMDLR